MSGGDPAKLLELLGPTLGRTFELMKIADEELAKAGNPPGAFMLLAPSAPFQVGTHAAVYRHHVRELIWRVVSGADLRPATDAEVLLGMVYASQASPLNRGGQLLYHRLFRSVMGAELHDQVGGLDLVPREQWEGQYEELLTEARRKVRDLGRPRRLETP